MSRSPAPKEPQRIAKLLARAGIASRREVERMIADGRVAIDGKVLDTPATLVASLRGVTVDGTPVEAPRPARLFLFHKPAGVLTTERDPKGRPTIYDRLPKDLPRLIPVGRLDYNTEGLLLLTTDGELKRQLELPATGVERAYRARAYGNVTQAQLEELIDGVTIDGIRYGGIDANLERRTGANVWIELVLTEGKNREVRRVLEHLGLEVSRLIRIRYGLFVLGDLPVGGIGEVRQHDLVAFRQALAKGKKAEGIVEVTAASASPSPTTVRPEPVEGLARRARTPPPPTVRPEPVEGRVQSPNTRTKRPPRSKPAPGPVRGRTDAGKPQSTSPLARGRPTLRPADGARGDAEIPAPPEKKPTPKRRPGWARPKPKPGPKRRK